MALCHRDPDFCFIHIFRAGGSSIRKALGGYETWEIGGWHWSLPQVRHHCERNDLWEWYESAFKFAVVRNPFDWLVSVYHYRTGNKNPIAHLKQGTFSDFAVGYCREREEITAAMPPGANPLLTLGEFIDGDDMDFFKFENLPEEWGEFSSRVLPRPAPLPHINASERKKGYRHAYTKAARDAVASHFAADLERFGYAF